MTYKENKPLLIGAGFGLALLFLLKSDKKESGGVKPSGSVSDFLKKNFPYAKAAGKITRVPANVTLTFAAIESGWGKHAPKFNYFGIKAGSDWKGATSTLKTPECFNSSTKHLKAEILSVLPPNAPKSFAACNKRGFYTYWINDKFRAYSSPAASFLDYGLFLHKHFPKAFQYSDPESFGAYILEHGYATGRYTEKFKTLLRSVQRITDKL